MEIPFPDHTRRSFPLHSCSAQSDCVAASILKDAGDDPDVTNGAEIIALVTMQEPGRAGEEITIHAGQGVGTVTKPGLSVAVGEPAINPVPRQMIRAAVNEALQEADRTGLRLTVTISVRDGERLAEKTLNRRLGIIGGLSILGTTGIVRPVSAEAWTATIEAAMNVARAGHSREAAAKKSLSNKPRAARLPSTRPAHHSRRISFACLHFTQPVV